MSANGPEVTIRDASSRPPERNDPCYCGSGKKYKKCHLDSDREAALAFQAALPQLRERQAREAALREKLANDYGTYINFALPVGWNGGKVWAIGSRLYLNRPARETFVEFLISLARQTFTEEWRKEQAALPEDRQHFFLKCSNELAKFKASALEPDEDGLFSAIPNGWVQYLINVAWDIATLIHATNLPPELVARLRAHDQFQGARYEVAVAAIFARLDCEIEYLDDNEWRDRPHPEFIATHRPSGLRVAVEAKSRHRPGVLNVPLSEDEEQSQVAEARGDVQNLLNKAIPKALDGMPFVVFIDVNAPSTLKRGRENVWQSDTKNWLNKKYDDVAESQPVSGIAITNFSPHYDGDDIAQGVEWQYFVPPLPSEPVPDAFASMLRHALAQYHHVPEITEDGRIRE